jgi:hypothetical protein
MLYTNILAEITSKMDISGVMCLASIPCIIVVLFAYSKGPYAGSCTCLIFFVISIFATGDMGDAGSGSSLTPNSTYITNRSQTKMVERYKYSINDPNCIFSIRDGIPGRTKSYAVFIPAEEMMVVDGYWRMKPDGKKIDSDAYYLYDETISPLNAPVEAGGSGIPQWVYHPAAPTWVFGIAGLPALLVGMFIASKIRG